MSRVDLGQALMVARQVAGQAARVLLQGKERGFSVEHKGAMDLVTESDRQSEALIVAELCRAFPSHTVISEEGSEVRGREGEVWLVDPLDGTTNYAHGLPIYAVSIGLEVDGEPAVGVVLAPELGWELWSARGQGAFFNGRPLRVSAVGQLDDALLATGFAYDCRSAEDNNVPEFATAIRHSQGVRRLGVASLDCALVARGLFDGYWELKLKPWDVAAGALLVLEAGGRVTDIDGGPYRSSSGRILATNGAIHRELMAMLASVRPR